MSNSIISLRNISKNYKVHERQKGVVAAIKSLFNRKFKTVEAVKNISLDIKQGEVIAFLGPNGAGKTTTIKLMTGLLHPDSGNINVLDSTPFERNHKFLKDITLMMGRRNQLVWDVAAIESYEMFKSIYDIPDDQYNDMLSELIEVFSLESILNVPVRNLSLGQRMRLELAGALLHKPKVLFLDEPTLGLDIVAQEKFRSLIRHYNETTNSTIILTSHYMGDVEALCNRVIIIDEGSILFDGSRKELVETFATHQILKVQIATPNADLSKYGKVLSVEGQEHCLEIDGDNTPKIVAEITKSFNVSNLAVTPPPMEDVIKHIYTRNEPVEKSRKNIKKDKKVAEPA